MPKFCVNAPGGYERRTRTTDRRAPPIDASRAEDARLMLEAADMLEAECTDRHTYAPDRDSPFAFLQAAQAAKKAAILETALRLRRAAKKDGP